MVSPAFARDRHWFRYGRGAIIFVQGDHATRLYLLLEGIVKLSIINEGGKERTIGFTRPYSLLGAPDVFAGSTYGITATAYTPVKVALFSANQAEDLLNDHEFISYLTSSLSQQTRSMGRQLAGDSFFNTSGRVAFALLDLERQIGIRLNAKMARLPITHRELAGYVGCNRVTVTKAIAELTAAGLVSTQKKNLFLLDLDALRHWLAKFGNL